MFRVFSESCSGSSEEGASCQEGEVERHAVVELVADCSLFRGRPQEVRRFYEISRQSLQVALVKFLELAEEPSKMRFGIASEDLDHSLSSKDCERNCCEKENTDEGMHDRR